MWVWAISKYIYILWKQSIYKKRNLYFFDEVLLKNDFYYYLLKMGENIIIIFTNLFIIGFIAHGKIFSFTLIIE